MRYIAHGVISDCHFVMATVNSPAPFCFQKTDKWPKWKCHFEQYRQSSSLADRGEEHKVNTFLYCLGDDAEEILQE